MANDISRLLMRWNVILAFVGIRAILAAVARMVAWYASDRANGPLALPKQIDLGIVDLGGASRYPFDLRMKNRTSVPVHYKLKSSCSCFFSEKMEGAIAPKADLRLRAGISLNGSSKSLTNHLAVVCENGNRPHEYIIPITARLKGLFESEVFRAVPTSVEFGNIAPGRISEGKADIYVFGEKGKSLEIRNITGVPDYLSVAVADESSSPTRLLHNENTGEAAPSLRPVKHVTLSLCKIPPAGRSVGRILLDTNQGRVGVDFGIYLLESFQVSPDNLVFWRSGAGKYCTRRVILDRVSSDASITGHIDCDPETFSVRKVSQEGSRTVFDVTLRTDATLSPGPLPSIRARFGDKQRVLKDCTIKAMLL